MNMRGVSFLESMYDGSMENGTGSTKRFPMDAATKEVIAATSLSGRNVLRAMIF